jgi:hypothetical protein
MKIWEPRNIWTTEPVSAEILANWKTGLKELSVRKERSRNRRFNHLCTAMEVKNSVHR